MTTHGLLGGFKVAGPLDGGRQMNALQVYHNRLAMAAAAGHPGAAAIMQLIAMGGARRGGGRVSGPTMNPWSRQPGFGPGGGHGFGVGRYGMMHGGRSAGIAGSPGFGLGSVAGHAGMYGYGVGELNPNNQYGASIPMGGYVPAPAASPLMGGFAPDPNAVALGWVDPNVIMGAPLGFDSGGTTLVAAAQQFQLTSRPQEIFRGERFVIGSDIAPSLVVSDLKVGNRSQLINATNVPGMAFANTTIGASLRFETAQPGQDIVWTGVNIAGGGLRVLGTLFGSAAVRK